MAHLLRANGLKVTPRRQELLKLLVDAQKPLSVRMLLERFTLKANQTTLYRSLEEFKRVGLVTQIYNGAEEAHYECACSDHHHHHITCTDCGAIDDIDTCLDSKTLKHISQKTGFTVTNHSIELHGICSQCSKK